MYPQPSCWPWGQKQRSSRRRSKVRRCFSVSDWSWHEIWRSSVLVKRFSSGETVSGLENLCVFTSKNNSKMRISRGIQTKHVSPQTQTRFTPPSKRSDESLPGSRRRAKKSSGSCAMLVQRPTKRAWAYGGTGTISLRMGYTVWWLWEKNNPTKKCSFCLVFVIFILAMGGRRGIFIDSNVEEALILGGCSSHGSCDLRQAAGCRIKKSISMLKWDAFAATKRCGTPTPTVINKRR